MSLVDVALYSINERVSDGRDGFAAQMPEQVAQLIEELFSWYEVGTGDCPAKPTEAEQEALGLLIKSFHEVQEALGGPPASISSVVQEYIAYHGSTADATGDIGSDS